MEESSLPLPPPVLVLSLGDQKPAVLQVNYRGLCKIKLLLTSTPVATGSSALLKLPCQLLLSQTEGESALDVCMWEDSTQQHVGGFHYSFSFSPPPLQFKVFLNPTYIFRDLKFFCNLGEQSLPVWTVSRWGHTYEVCK